MAGVQLLHLVKVLDFYSLLEQYKALVQLVQVYQVGEEGMFSSMQ